MLMIDIKAPLNQCSISPFVANLEDFGSVGFLLLLLLLFQSLSAGHAAVFFS